MSRWRTRELVAWMALAAVGCSSTALPPCGSDEDCASCEACVDGSCRPDPARLNACGTCGALSEICGDELDNDCDGTPDDGCACGNGRLDPGETCDGDCPTRCDDGQACTADELSGRPALCDVVCGHHDITTCAGGDGCCPAGCSAASDADCPRGWVSGVYDPLRLAEYPPAKVDFSALTHLLVLGLEPRGDGTVYQPPAQLWVIDDLVRRAHAAGRKALVVVGSGSGVSEQAYRSAAAAAQRSAFVGNLLAAVDERGADGLDLNWTSFDPATDGADLLALAGALRAARAGLVLTMTFEKCYSNVPLNCPAPWFATNAEALAQLFDQLNLRTWAVSGAYSGWVSWHFSPLFGHGPDHPISVSQVASSFAERGIPAAKIGIGIGFSGTCWRGPSGPLQAFDAATAHADNNDGVFTFANLVARYRDPNPAAVAWDETARQRHLSFPAGFAPPGWQPNGDPGYPTTCNWISFEDEGSIADKGAWARANGFGGALLWTLGAGCTDAAAGTNPLLDASGRAFLE